MIKLITAAAIAACVALSPALAWDLQDMNNTVDQTNFVVNERCAGTLIDLENRYVLTADHCVGRSNDPRTARQGTESYSVVIVAKDPRTDLALLQIKGDIPQTLASTVLPEGREITRGEPVWIVGNPMGSESTVTKGIVSYVQRQLTGAKEFPLLTQVDAGLYPGNSGGAVYNDRGELIGVPVMVHSTAANLGMVASPEALKAFLSPIYVDMDDIVRRLNEHMTAQEYLCC